MTTSQGIESSRRTEDVATKAAASAPVTLSIVMPVFNEVATVERVIKNVQKSEIGHELIVVDDGSNDGTEEVLRRFTGINGIHILRLAKNSGKGAALKLGFSQARGRVLIIQDADLEYRPAEYPLMIEPILNGEVDVVYGSRFLSVPDAAISRKAFWANRIITAFFNRITGQHLTDVETCFKAFRREVLWQIAPSLLEPRFGIEIELCARIAKLPGVRITERPIHYHPRTYREGKKIRWRDGMQALWCILRYGYFAVQPRMRPDFTANDDEATSAFQSGNAIKSN